MRVLGTTAASAYRLDVDQLARETLDQQQRIMEQTGRTPCAVRVHSQTRREVMRHKPSAQSVALRYWHPTADGLKRDTFFGMAVIIDDTVPLGYATLEVCDGCMSIGAACVSERS
jgi:hypothetical protein